ncbi:hypothetical protein HY375_01380 [Candidatus Berkelbacteria bacterium]|nr:hypothetical protein [Candidatus Berkelbacteria bacterium]
MARYSVACRGANGGTVVIAEAHSEAGLDFQIRGAIEKDLRKGYRWSRKEVILELRLRYAAPQAEIQAVHVDVHALRKVDGCLLKVMHFNLFVYDRGFRTDC